MNTLNRYHVQLFSIMFLTITTKLKIKITWAAKRAITRYIKALIIYKKLHLASVFLCSNVNKHICSSCWKNNTYEKTNLNEYTQKSKMQKNVIWQWPNNKNDFSLKKGMSHSPALLILISLSSSTGWRHTRACSIEISILLLLHWTYTTKHIFHGRQE